MHPSLRTLLAGTRDEASSLFKLCGHSDELLIIWQLVQAAWADDLFSESIRRHNESEGIAFAHVDTARFPKPANRNANMMPFLLGDKTSLPEHLRVYWPMIQQCTATLPGGRRASKEHGALSKRVGYLTVQESVVPAGASQRRPGLHTEGFTRLPYESAACLCAPYWHGWGFGHSMGGGEYTGGIFMASNVDDSCHVYNCLVPPELVGRGGDIEHLRETLQKHLPAPPRPRKRCEPAHAAPSGRTDPKGAPVGDAHMEDFSNVKPVDGPISLQANELFWMTDRTPHASVPLAEGTHRQFFRLVAGKVDAWFAAHSTPNPLGTLPDAQIVDIDKFTGRVRPPPGEGPLSSWQKVRKALLAHGLHGELSVLERRVRSGS